MPELPEVETVRRGLAPVMEGRRLARVIQNRADLRWPLPERFAERLAGRRVERLGRRSKYLLLGLDGAETLIVHLGMSGRMLVEGAVVGEHVHVHGRIPAHDHVILEIEGGARVTFNDARRFGSMDLWPTDRLDAHRLLAGLGPEPLGNGFSAARLAERFEGRSASVKAALLDQRCVAGLGNIYVCEALFRSGLSPRRTSSSLAKRGPKPTHRAERLVPAIRTVLEEAIRAGGSTLRDYRQADGALGYFQHTFAVYGREGEACTRSGCNGTIRRIVQAGRSTFYCPTCQR
jgi:formamidopyrimidine-DNA glycosylase